MYEPYIYSLTWTKSSGNVLPRKRLPLAQHGRRTAPCATCSKGSGDVLPRKSLPLAQRGRRADPSATVMRTAPATSGHARACPLRSTVDARILVLYLQQRLRRRPATQELTPCAARSTHGSSCKSLSVTCSRGSSDVRPRKSLPLAQRGRRVDPCALPAAEAAATCGHARAYPLRSTVDARILLQVLLLPAAEAPATSGHARACPLRSTVDARMPAVDL
eukprot:s46_g16.t1